jgi:hypothetical protein
MFCIIEGVLPRKSTNEVRGEVCSHHAPYKHTEGSQSLSIGFAHLNIEYAHDGVEIYDADVDDGISEIES